MKITKLVTTLTISLLITAGTSLYASSTCGCTATQKAAVKKACPPDSTKDCCAEKSGDACKKPCTAKKADAKKCNDVSKKVDAKKCKVKKSVEGCKSCSAKKEVKWLTDFEVALATAKKAKLPILIDFSGSDWCGWCIKLDEEVLSKKEFKDYAATNLVLVMADFPRAKKQSDKLKKQNSELSKKYAVRGFPTVLLVDADGKLIAKTGYQAGGPVKYVEHLKTLLKK